MIIHENNLITRDKFNFNFKMKKAIILGYHEASCVLLDELEKNNIKVCLIIGDYRKHNTQTNSWYRDIRSLAKKKKIRVLERKNLKGKKTIDLIKRLKPNIIFSVFTSHIISQKIINIPNLGCYNFHNSDLPEERGRGAPIFTLSKGKTKTAFTMHHVSQKIDRGDIVDKEKVFIEKNDDIKRLYLKHNFAIKKILDRQLPKIKKNKLVGYPQKKINQNINVWIDGESDFLSFRELSDKEIIKKVNSYKYPFKGVKSSIGKKIISVHDVEISKIKTLKKIKPGTIIKIGVYDIIVKAKTGCVKVKELSQFERHILPTHYCKMNNIKKSMRFK